MMEYINLSKLMDVKTCVTYGMKCIVYADVMWTSIYPTVTIGVLPKWIKASWHHANWALQHLLLYM